MRADLQTRQLPLLRAAGRARQRRDSLLQCQRQRRVRGRPMSGEWMEHVTGFCDFPVWSGVDKIQKVAV